MQTNSYQLDDAGLPVIVKAAKEWWQTEGKFHDWLAP